MILESCWFERVQLSWLAHAGLALHKIEPQVRDPFKRDPFGNRMIHDKTTHGNQFEADPILVNWPVCLGWASSSNGATNRKSTNISTQQPQVLVRGVSTVGAWIRERKVDGFRCVKGRTKWGHLYQSCLGVLSSQNESVPKVYEYVCWIRFADCSWLFHIILNGAIT